MQVPLLQSVLLSGLEIDAAASEKQKNPNINKMITKSFIAGRLHASFKLN